MKDIQIANLIDKAIEANKDHRHCIDCGARIATPSFPPVMLTKDDMLCRDCRLRHYGPLTLKEKKKTV